MNKKEFIETLIDIGGCGAKPTSWSRGWDDAISEAIRIAEDLDEPKKPVIPQFVADYIELNKGWSGDRQEYVEGENTGLWFALNGDNYGMPNSVSDWLFNEEKVETFARAWLDGYEVEKEKNYEVIIGKGALGGYPSLVVLYKSIVDVMVLREMTLSDYGESKRRVPTSFWLTEKEIKDYDKRYWDFAEEVTE